MMNANYGERRCRYAPLGTLGFLAVSLAMCLPVHGQPVQVTVDQGVYYPYQLLILPNSAGDTMFDPTDGGRMYVAVDATKVNNGAIYRVNTLPSGAMALGDRVLQMENPSCLAFTASGDLYVCQDYAGDIWAIRAPRNGAPYNVDALPVIDQFGGANDDDPIAIGIAPAAFSGAVAKPGDLIIADRGYDGNDPNEFFVYTPGSTPGEVGTPTDPKMYINYMSATRTLAAYDKVDMVDFEFSTDGTSMYALFANSKLVQIGPDCNIIREASLTSLTGPAALAVDPVTSRIWVASDTLDEVWSIDPTTETARRELKFARTGAAAAAAIDFNDPSMRFSSDGSLLTVSDAYAPGYIWIFKKATGTNHAPVVKIATNPPSAIVGYDTLSLDGSASTDGDGGNTGLLYEWVQTGGPAPATFESPTSAVTNVSLPTKGTYTFTLKVNDQQATDNIAYSSVFVMAPDVTVTTPRNSSVVKATRVFGDGGYPGEAAFDPMDNNRIYVTKDGTTAQGGGIYRLDKKPDGSYKLGEKIAQAANPSSLTFTPDGTLWWVLDGTAAELSRVVAPRNGPPYTVEKVISSFSGSGDDDTAVVTTVPPGFSSSLVKPGDLLIADRGVDADTPQGIYVLSPSAYTGTALTGYSTFFAPTSVLTAYTSDLDSLSFGPDPNRGNETVLYANTDNGVFLKFTADGTLLGEFPVTGIVRPTGTNPNVDSMGVNPRNGRIWIGDDNIDQLWSIDPATGAAQLEASFFRYDGLETRPDYQINFHDPSIKFSSDGSKMIVCDTTQYAAEGWFWVLEIGDPFPFDWDNDTDVDADDLTELAKCATAPAVPQTVAACTRADVDKDGDVDQVDFAIFQLCYTGAGGTYDPECVR